LRNSWYKTGSRRWAFGATTQNEIEKENTRDNNTHFASSGLIWLPLKRLGLSLSLILGVITATRCITDYRRIIELQQKDNKYQISFPLLADGVLAG
jgi:hypothetical protein